MICSVLLFILALQNIPIVNSQGSPFGKQISSNVFAALPNNSILTEQTELYCKTDLVIYTTVIWNSIDRYAIKTRQNTPTDQTTGVSFLTVDIDAPGLYSCKVSLGSNFLLYFATVLVPGIYEGDPYANHHSLLPSYSFLSDAILTTTSTLYCVSITTMSSWAYTDLEGRTMTQLTDSTGTNSMVSILEAKIDNPGTYSCTVNLISSSQAEFSVNLIPNSYTAPTTGCTALSSNGWCFNHYTNTVEWTDAQEFCESLGENLATVYSGIENDALESLGSNCWIGYNDIEQYNTFRWIDGSPVTYTNWGSSQPNNAEDKDGVRLSPSKTWFDIDITNSLDCFYCGKQVHQFGRAIAQDVYIALPDNSVLSASTTLICLTEVTASYVLTWKYETLNGTSTYPAGSTDPATGVSTLPIDEPGYYSCAVTENGGDDRTYTVTLLDLSIYTLIESSGSSFTYTREIDREYEFIYCHKTFNSISFLNHGWVDVTSSDDYPNPLNVRDLPSDESEFGLECDDTLIPITILTVDILVQGPPEITFDTGTTNTQFALLPRAVNQANLDVLTTNVLLSVNLIGEWEMPDGTIFPNSVLQFSEFGVSDAGLYSFYVTNWHQERTLAIQILISVNPFGRFTFGQDATSALTGYPVYTTQEILFCIPDDPITPVSWYTIDLAGMRTNSDGVVTDGLSKITVLFTNLYYICEVTLENGSIDMHTVLFLDASTFTVVETSASYTYTEDIDTRTEYLFCHKSDNSVPFAYTVWRELGSDIDIPNPLVIGPTLTETRRYIMECVNSQTDERILVIDLLLQGPPKITLEADTIATFTSLAGNFYDAVTLEAKNVLLSINLVGRWKEPDDSYAIESYIVIPSFEVADQGAYTFYVTNWGKQEVTAILIYITIHPFGEQITANNYERLAENVILTASTTLYCITDTQVLSEVVWKYTDTTGSPFQPGSYTEETTGISLLYAKIDQSGLYTCVYSYNYEFTIALLDPSIYTVIESTDTFTYTKGIDPENTFLFCYSSSIPLEATVLSDSSSAASPINPVNIGIIPSSVVPHIFECKESEAVSPLFTVAVNVQGPPTITLESVTYDLLPTDTNRAYINLAESVNLLANIPGKWIIPNGEIVLDESIIFSSFQFSNVGLYEYYVIGWDKEDVLAIQILLNVFPFGHQIDPTTYEYLEDNTVLTAATTLYCITELTANTMSVTWIKKGFSTPAVEIESISTDTETGFSSLVLDITQSAFYSCEVIQDEIDTIHKIVLLDQEYTVVEAPKSYTFTDGIDSDNTHLFCQMTDKSVEIDTMLWNELGSDQFSTNPLNIGALNKDGSIHTMICSDPLSDETVLGVNLLLQGPPIITLNTGTTTPFSDLTPGNNNAYINYRTKNVLLSINLFGRWQKPDDSYEEDNFIEFPTFEVDNQGVYKFFVYNWNEIETLAIQILLTVYPFGEQIDANTYMQLEDNSVLTVDTTLYCITEFETTPGPVVWQYIDFDGGVVADSAVADPATGFSSLLVSVAMSGYHSCRILQDDSSITHPIAVLEPSFYTVVETPGSFMYTINIDREDVNLFCHNSDNSLLFENIEWREQDMTDSVSNPLFIERVPNDGDNHLMECFDRSTGVVQFTVDVFIQGPPVITLDRGSVVSFTLLPPQINTAYVTLNTPGVVLQVNLAGYWLGPDGNSVSESTIPFRLFDAGNEGLYQFYVNNWEGGETLAIQILLKVYPFGEQIASSTFLDLSDYSVLTANTTLYCINGDAQVYWKYQDLSGYTIDRSGTSDISGASILSVYTHTPGFYSCEYVQDGMTYTYTVAVLDTAIQELIESSESYSYTIGIDKVDTFLYCHKPDNSIQFPNIHWREISSQASFKNPLDVSQVANLLKYTSSYSIECIDITSNVFILSVGIYIQGPPVLTLSKGSPQSFSLVYPRVNNAYINVMTQDVVLSTNIAGKWKRPDDTHVSDSSLTFPSFEMSNTGLYKFYITDWYNEQTLAIQIRLLLSESYTQGIVDLTAVTSSDTSILVTWLLLTQKTDFSAEKFTIYYGYEGVEYLAGTTENLYFSVNNLTINFNYTIRVDLQFALSTNTYTSTIYHSLMPITDAPPSLAEISALDVATQEKVLIAVIAILLLVIAAMIITVVISAVYIKKRISSKNVKGTDTYGLTTFVNK